MALKRVVACTQDKLCVNNSDESRSVRESPDESAEWRVESGEKREKVELPAPSFGI